LLCFCYKENHLLQRGIIETRCFCFWFRRIQPRVAAEYRGRGGREDGEATQAEDGCWDDGAGGERRKQR
jgi:hypothetical protein